MFQDRLDAGKQLADILENVDIVCSIPRGGIPIGYPICLKHKTKMTFAFPRKIGAPGHKEYAIGVINRFRDQFINESACQQLKIDQAYIDQETANELNEIEKRQALYPCPVDDLTNQNVVICDDGMATGFTMIAAVKEIERLNPKSITVAIPVCSKDAYSAVEKHCRVVTLSTPDHFGAVGSFYREFPQVEYEEAKKLLDEINRLK